MSASIVRTSIRQAAAIKNKRFYTTAPPTGNPQNGSGNGPVVLGLIAAGGAGYYLYQRNLEANKGPVQKKGEELDQKAQEAKQYVSEKADEAKAKYEQGKSDARQAVNDKVDEAKDKYQDAKSSVNKKVDELKKDGANHYEATKQAAADKGQEIQKKVGDKVAETGKDIKEKA